jgi:hypothetical protein
VLVRTVKVWSITSLKSDSSDALVSMVPSACGTGRWSVAEPTESPIARSSTVTRRPPLLRARLSRRSDTIPGTGSKAMAVAWSWAAVAMSE